MKRVWITRASPGAEATAGRVRALGWEPLIAPLLETRILPTTIDLTGVGALAFTSATGARAFGRLSMARDLPVFAVGSASAAAAREAGFAAVRSADGDVKALARFIGEHAGDFAGVVLHTAAAEPAGDLVGMLMATDVQARVVAVYETIAAPVPADLWPRLSSIEAVLVHSPRAGRRLAEILKDVAAPGLVAYCLSAEVLASLGDSATGAKFAAPLPNEDALLSLLRDHRSPSRKAT